MAKIKNLTAYEQNARKDRDAYFHIPGFESYRAMALRVLNGTGQEASNLDWILNIQSLYENMIKNRDDFKNFI